MRLEIWIVCVICQHVRASVSVHDSISRNLVNPQNLLYTDSSVTRIVQKIEQDNEFRLRLYKTYYEVR